MSLIKKKNSDMTSLTVVIGSSRLGASLAYENSSKGFYTTLVDKDKNAFKKVDANYTGFFLEGDATDENVLAKAHIKEASQCIIVTEDDSVNIYVASLVALLSKAWLIVVRLHDEKKALLLHDPRFRVISPSLLAHDAYEAILNGEKKGNL